MSINLPELEYRREGKKIKSNTIKVKNFSKENKTADLYIYGAIIDNTDWKWDETDVMPEDVKEAIEGLQGLDQINIYINSPGGSVFSGMAIYNMLKRNKAKKIVYVDGIAASMASVLALVGDEIYMPENSYFMIHKPYTVAMGNADEMRKVADDLEVIEEGMMTVYESNIKEGVDIEVIREMVNDETWLTAEETSKYFEVTLTDPIEIAAKGTELLGEYKNVPKELTKIKRSEENDTDSELLKIQNELDLLEVLNY